MRLTAVTTLLLASFVSLCASAHSTPGIGQFPDLLLYTGHSPVTAMRVSLCGTSMTLCSTPAKSSRNSDSMHVPSKMPPCLPGVSKSSKFAWRSSRMLSSSRRGKRSPTSARNAPRRSLLSLRCRLTRRRTPSLPSPSHRPGSSSRAGCIASGRASFIIPTFLIHSRIA
ncbi:hypothetical protein FA13DRAFT_608093 [Coprinellus micaceus]|uniref:Secreted protein n=1 Tax=Coprinellus micaceus TaxID=71717 RepID=A0A4Y7SA49_COPMI|nr:hypothetical protein FA13DRAFT_608093 [Coprinellus micaceus]